MLELWAQAVGMDLESALLYRLSLTDALLRAPTTAAIWKRCCASWPGRSGEAAGRRCTSIIDDFKQVNDRFGHDAGDAVLVETAALHPSTACAGEDVVLRYGGDEFRVLLTGSSAGQAESIARRIDEELRARPVQAGDAAISISGSVGVASDGTAQSFDELLKQVDRAMYAAKRGR